MVNNSILENYIHEHIPISTSLGIQVTQASPQEVILSAPLFNNLNHKKTAFGGSLHAVATLTCWSLLYVNLKNTLECSEIVIANSDVQYLLPVTTNFEARCLMPDKKNWHQFIKILNRMHRARIKLSAQIFQNTKLAVDYHGTFVAFKK